LKAPGFNHWFQSSEELQVSNLAFKLNLYRYNVDEDIRVGLDRVKYQIQVPLPVQLEACVYMMHVEEGVVDTDYADVGGCEEQLRLIREVVELPLLHPALFYFAGRHLKLFPPPSAQAHGGGG
jgi:26S proteasome regulatory subunit T1